MNRQDPTEIHKNFTIERVDLKTTHAEADNIFAYQMVAAAHNQTGISVVSDVSSDVFVLLRYHYRYHYQAQILSLPVVMESPIKKRGVIDIGQTVQRNSDIVSDLIATNAIFGCDTVACFHSI